MANKTILIVEDDGTEGRFRTIFNVVNDAIFIHDFEGRLLEVNDLACRRLGYRREEMLRLSLSDIDAPEHAARVPERMQELREKGHILFEGAHVTRDGRRIPIEVSARLIKFAGKSAVIGVARDISERVRAEEALRQHREQLEELVEARTAELQRANDELAREIAERMGAEEALRQERDFAKSLIETAQAIVLVLDVEGRIVSFNPYMEEISGYQLEEVRGKDWFDTFLPERDWKRVHELFLRAIDNIQTRGNVNPIVTKDGRERKIEWYDKTLVDANGNVIGLLATGQDISERVQAEEELRKYRDRLEELVEERTAELQRANDKLVCANDELAHEIAERKRAEAALQESERFLQSVLDAIQDGISVSDRNLNILRVNRAIEQWYSHALPLTGKKCFEAYYAGRSQPCENCPSLRALEQGTPQMEVVPWGGPEGTTIGWQELYAFPLLDAAGNIAGVVEYVRDISERKRAEEALRESEARHRELAQENARLLEQARRSTETKVTLLHEVNHRVGNLLLALTGILGVEEHRARAKGQSEALAILQDMSNRVQGLSTVHKMLSAAEWEPLWLDNLTWQIVDGILPMVPTNKHVSLEVSSSPVRVTAKQAHKLALVINELATNTVKYALTERRAAHISVRITPDEEAGEDIVLFEFRDDGPGYPDGVLRLEHYNVGLDLIGAMVRDLDGELSLCNEGGAVAAIRFKALVERET